MSSRLTNVDALKAEVGHKLQLSDIAEALGIDLQPSGGQFKGLCPLHGEDTPSFFVSDAKGSYHCFGCKAGGDAIDLVERVNNLGFIEAMYWLAQLADIDISAYERPLTQAEKEQEALRDWCEAWLAKASRTFKGRVPEHLQQEYGVVERATAAHVGDVPAYFRNDKGWMLDGVIFPYRLPSGKLVGWRIREHPGEEKRAIGTPNDFPLKEETLFGIRQARERLGTRLILVEGEYDCLRCVAEGFTNVVAMGGSTLTDGQLALIRSLHIQAITLVFDGDAAGRTAAHKYATALWDSDINVHVTVCPDDYDPESMIDALGESMFEALEADAPHALEYLLREKWFARPGTSLTDKLDFVDWIRTEYGTKLQSVDMSLVLAEVAKWLDLDELEIRDHVRGHDTSLAATESERMLLGRALRDRQYYLLLRGMLAKDDFFMLRHQRIWDMLESLLIEDLDGEPITVMAMADRFGVPQDYLQGTYELPDANLSFHQQRVADLSLRRSARDDAQDFKDQIVDLQRPAEQLVGELTTNVTQKALRKAGASIRQLSEQVDTAMDTLHTRMTSPTAVHGLDLGTQFPMTSQTLQGLQDKRLVLIAAISGMGKSSLAIAWSASLAVHQSIPIDFVSLEMDETEILFKIASHMTGIDSMKISGGALESHQAKSVEYAMARVRKSPLHIWAPDGLCATEFVLYARESVMRRRTQAFFLDYVQLTDPDPGMERENGYIQFGHFGRLAKMRVARAMDVAVVCCAQLNRNASGKERPTKEDMGDSYALVRHSDVIVILNGKEDSNLIDLWVDKNRQGIAGRLMPVMYNKATNTFYEVSGGLKDPEYIVRA